MFLLSSATHRMVLGYHPVIGHLYVPGVNARIPNERGASYVKTNAQGFRSDLDFAAPKGKRPRILFFGDSYTAGDGVDNRDRFAERIGEALGAEVYNYGLAGSGTDQHVLILEELAKGVEADLIVLGVAAHNIDRIKVPYREYIERSTGKTVLGPKPYFTLDGAQLSLHNVPVPLARPDADEATGAVSDRPHTHDADGTMKIVNRMRDGLGIRKVEGMLEDRLPDLKPKLRSAMLRMKDFQPHEDYQSPDTPGWKLMAALVRRFHRAAGSIPVLVVPIPTYYYYMDELAPKYQPLFESLADPERGLHVMNLTAPILKMPREERKRIPLGKDTHFSPFGHGKIAEFIGGEIRNRQLLPAAPPSVRPAPAPGDKPQYILGLSCFYHNSGAALIRDGEIVAAAEEERFSRVKNDPRFPHHSVNFCLEEAGIQPNDLAAVVYYDNAALTFERILHTLLALGEKGEEAWMRIMPFWTGQKLHIPQLIRHFLGYDGKVLQNIHHRSHAASAFYPSPFEKAAILTIDGVGEWATASIGVGNGSEIKILKEMRFPNSLGLLYSAFTQFTGFKVNSGEYKMMGLAPYGDPKYADLIRQNMVSVKDDGSVELNLDYFGFLSEGSMTSPKVADLFGGPPREIESRITRREIDIARSAQVVTEEAMLKMAAYAKELTGEDNLCMAGGVVLNCVANGRILREGPFREIWIQPAAGDSGAALGAALDAWHTYFRKPRTLREDGRAKHGASWWGPGYSDAEIKAFLDTYGCPAHHVSPEERARTVADLLAAGKVVGHFTGRTEFGPRALGARSIIGDARNPEMQTRLNLKIKYRESFRPFAPVCLAEKIGDYFEIDRESPYMLLVAPVKESRRLPLEAMEGDDLLEIVRKPRSDLPAITHVDYSARIQSATKEENPGYYDVIKAFDDMTGYGVIVNTSFNVRGEPIVNTPWEAYRCFMRTEMDVLVLENFILYKEEQPADSPIAKTPQVREAAAPQPENAELREALRALYRERFQPLARKLAGTAAVRVSTRTKGADSFWDDYAEPESPELVFAVPAPMDAETVDPTAMAAALAGFWTPGEATEALRPVLAELLKIAAKLPKMEVESEVVSESMYVMY